MRFNVLSKLQLPLFTSMGRVLVLVLMLVIASAASTRVLAAEPAAVHATEAAAHAAPAGHGEHGGNAEAEHHGLPSAAPELPAFTIGPLKVTNSMIFTWIIAAIIIIFARIATRRMKEVPDGAQNFWEWMVESLRDFLASIVGEKLARRTFWFFASVFIFILFTNWFGLLPGVGTIGWGYPSEQGGLSHISQPLFRGVSADLNMTLAMSLIFFGCWIYWSITSHGFTGMVAHLFGNPARNEMKGFLAFAMGLIFVVVGLLEVVSILFRPVSLSFRLYGNIFAGENLLESMMNIIPVLGWLIPIPFYFMELLVGFVQALVFMLLTAVFTVLMIGGDEEHAHGGQH